LTDDGTDLEVDGRRVKSFRDISNPLLKAGEKVIAQAYKFLAAHRVIDVYNELAVAKVELKTARDANAAAALAVPAIRAPNSATKMARLKAARTTWQGRYDKVNPTRTTTDPKTGKPKTKRALPIKDARKIISEVEAGVKNGDANSQILVNFKQEYGDFNHHLVQFLFDTGQITNDKKLTLQKLSYVPFMRDQGWEQSQPLVNSKSDGSRGPMMIDKSLEGSWAELDPNLFGSIISNISSVTRDGLWNIAAQRTIRDELFVGTAREITSKNRSGEGKRLLDEAGFSDIVVMLKIDGEDD